MTDDELQAAGWAVGLQVWGPVTKAYGNFVGDMTLANSQLYSLAQAIRAQALAEAGRRSDPERSDPERSDPVG
jgi:hypothetical protein